MKRVTAVSISLNGLRLMVFDDTKPNECFAQAVIVELNGFR